MKNLLTGVSFVFILAVHQSALSQITYDGCRDIRGIAVASIADFSINDVAVASLAPNGVPIVRYNPRVLSQLAPQTRLFFYAHECAHHERGHAFGTVHPLSREQDADCFAIKTLVDKGMVGDDDIAAIQQDLSQAQGDWSHLPGPDRAINLRRCLGRSNGSPPPSSRPLACCDQYGRKWCQIAFNPGPLGSPCFCNGVRGSGNICQ
jgi:hypothetical protein